MKWNCVLSIGCKSNKKKENEKKMEKNKRMARRRRRKKSGRFSLEKRMKLLHMMRTREGSLSICIWASAKQSPTKAIFYLFIFLPFGRFYMCAFHLGGNNSIYVFHGTMVRKQLATASIQ